MAMSDDVNVTRRDRAAAFRLAAGRDVHKGIGSHFVLREL